MTFDLDRSLTDAGRAEVEALAKRHGVTSDAVAVLLQALDRGGGEQAQFSHPDLGGMGQWSRRGMIMVGDMFNDALKARVDALCRDTAALLDKPGIMTTVLRGDQRSGTAWWPEGLGRPSATGAQNDRRYACFPGTRRLAIQRDGRIEIYDTGEHRVHGVSQQQGGGTDLRFASQLGTVSLEALRRIDVETTGHADAPGTTSPDPRPATANDAEARPPQTSGGGDPLDLLERLHALHSKGVLSDAEFVEKKRELLARI